LGVGNRRIVGLSVAFEGVVPRSGGVHGLQWSLSADAKRRPPLGGCGLLA
jgi:hypothetical protein